MAITKSWLNSTTGFIRCMSAHFAFCCFVGFLLLFFFFFFFFFVLFCFVFFFFFFVFFLLLFFLVCVCFDRFFVVVNVLFFVVFVVVFFFFFFFFVLFRMLCSDAITAICRCDRFVWYKVPGCFSVRLFVKCVLLIVEFDHAFS